MSLIEGFGFRDPVIEFSDVGEDKSQALALVSHRSTITFPKQVLGTDDRASSPEAMLVQLDSPDGRKWSDVSRG
jgi:hypothetical protein